MTFRLYMSCKYVFKSLFKGLAPPLLTKLVELDIDILVRFLYSSGSNVTLPLVTVGFSRAACLFGVID